MNGPEVLRQLLQQSHHARPEDLPEMAMRAAPLVGATAMVIYLVDHQQRLLLPLLSGSAPAREPFRIDGTLGGRAFSLVTVCVSEAESDGLRVWVPLLDGAERLGVLEVVTDEPLDDAAVDDWTAVSALLGELVASRSHYSDTIERVRRRDHVDRHVARQRQVGGTPQPGAGMVAQEVVEAEPAGHQAPGACRPGGGVGHGPRGGLSQDRAPQSSVASVPCGEVARQPGQGLWRRPIVRVNDGAAG